MFCSIGMSGIASPQIAGTTTSSTANNPLNSYTLLPLVVLDGSGPGDTYPCFSTRDIYINNGVYDTLYRGLLLEPPFLDTSLTDSTWGFRKTQELKIRFSNMGVDGSPGMFTLALRNGSWGNMNLRKNGFIGQRVYAGWYEPGDSDPRPMPFTGYVTDYKFTDEYFEITASDDTGWQDGLFPPFVLTADTFKSHQSLDAFRPNVDFGKALTWSFGNVKDVPLLLINNDTTAKHHDYLLWMNIGATAVATDLTVYRSADGETWALVPNSAYDDTVNSVDITLPDGRTGTALYIRFDVEQTDWNLNFYKLKADFNTGAVRDHASLIASLIYQGGKSINSYNLDGVRALLKCKYADIALSEQKNFRDIIDDCLAVSGLSLSFNNSEEYIFGLDQYTPSDSATLGYRDGFYNNIIEVREWTPINRTIKSIAMKYRYSPSRQSFLQEIRRPLFEIGKTQETVETASVWDHATADWALCRMQRKIAFGQGFLTVLVGMEMRNLLINSAVKIASLSGMDVSGRFQVIAKRQKSLTTYELDLQQFSEQQFLYVPDTLPSEGGTGEGGGGPLSKTTIQMEANGGASVLTTGVKSYIYIPFDCVITECNMLAQPSGSVVVDIWKAPYADFPPTDADSIVASAPPTITSDVKSSDVTLTGWTKTLSTGDVLAFNFDSVSTITMMTLSLTIERT